jgi:hypothetical protein
MRWENTDEKASWITAGKAYKPARMNGAAFADIGRPKPQTLRELSANSDHIA